MSVSPLTLPIEPKLAGDVPVGLGAAMAGGRTASATSERRANDFYPTPRAVTRALIARECNAMRSAMRRDGVIWEPCGRGGAIARELAAAGLDVVATDIVADPAHDCGGLDVLAARRALSRAVVTNPPFAIAEPIIRRLLEWLGVEYCALLLKATFWHAAARTALFRQHRPARIWALNWRPDFLGRGAPTMDVVWVVWDHNCRGLGTRYDVLEPERATDLFAAGGHGGGA